MLRKGGKKWLGDIKPFCSIFSPRGAAEKSFVPFAFQYNSSRLLYRQRIVRRHNRIDSLRKIDLTFSARVGCRQSFETSFVISKHNFRLIRHHVDVYW